VACHTVPPAEGLCDTPQIRNIASERPCNRGMTFEDIQGHYNCCYWIGRIRISLTVSGLLLQPFPRYNRCMWLPVTSRYPLPLTTGSFQSHLETAALPHLTAEYGLARWLSGGRRRTVMLTTRFDSQLLVFYSNSRPQMDRCWAIGLFGAWDRGRRTDHSMA